MVKEEITVTTKTDVADSEGNLITTSQSSNKMTIEIKEETKEAKEPKEAKGYGMEVYASKYGQ